MMSLSTLENRIVPFALGLVAVVFCILFVPILFNTKERRLALDNSIVQDWGIQMHGLDVIDSRYFSAGGVDNSNSLYIAFVFECDAASYTKFVDFNGLLPIQNPREYVKLSLSSDLFESGMQVDESLMVRNGTRVFVSKDFQKRRAYMETHR